MANESPEDILRIIDNATAPEIMEMADARDFLEKLRDEIDARLEAIVEEIGEDDDEGGSD